MSDTAYTRRRGELETYFDRTAVQAWMRLTSDAPVGRIRATVRAGRDQTAAIGVGVVMGAAVVASLAVRKEAFVGIVAVAMVVGLH